MIKRAWIIVLLATMLVGCPGQWVRVDDNRVLSTDYYTVDLPSQWIKVQLQGVWLVTRDGPALQKVVLRAADHDKAFPAIALESSTELLPSELAERYVAEIRKEDADGLPSFKLDSNQPLVIAGHEGFRIEASYRTQQGVSYRLIGVGLATEKGFVSITYTAPTIHYYDRHKGQFERIIGSLKTL